MVTGIPVVILQDVVLHVASLRVIKYYTLSVLLSIVWPIFSSTSHVLLDRALTSQALRTSASEKGEEGELGSLPFVSFSTDSFSANRSVFEESTKASSFLINGYELPKDPPADFY